MGKHSLLVGRLIDGHRLGRKAELPRTTCITNSKQEGTVVARQHTVVVLTSFVFSRLEAAFLRILRP
jgi:hypothetical protein